VSVSRLRESSRLKVSHHGYIGGSTRPVCSRTPERDVRGGQEKVMTVGSGDRKGLLSDGR
jgi:hypothetical protein